MDLLQQFKENWTKKFSKNNAVLLATSGGVDSMVMADLFRKAGITIGIAHCNFQLRGADAGLDEAFVKEWSEKNNVPFFLVRFATQQISEEWKKGIQETARILRYKWLEETRKANGFTAVATAHHANDNAETLLINLFKGTGISGLHGIRERNDQVIRPLLYAMRKDIEAYAAEQRIAFREDVSNASDKYLRNAVRLNIIPVAEQYFPGVVDRLNDSIRIFRQAEILYQKEVHRQLKKLVEKRGSNIYIPVRKLGKTEAVETLFYELFRGYGFTAAQVPQITRLAEAGSGHFIASPSHRVIKDREFLIITPNANSETDFISVDEVPASIETDRLSFHFAYIPKSESIPAAPAIAFIDAARIALPLVLRKWRSGDYFYPLGMNMKKKKLSRFLIDQKIPLHEKENVWVLESQKRIIWVAGMRLDERFRVKATTERILRVEIKP